MKKIGIVLSSAIMMGVFLYALSFISSKNTCTGIRIYECSTLQKKQAEQFAQEQAAAQLATQQQAVVQQAAAAKINTRTRAS